MIMDSLKMLKQILEKMVKVHQRLLDLAKEKRVILVEGRISHLQNVVNQESLCVEQIQKLEEERRNQTTHYLQSIGVPSGRSTMDMIIESLENQAEKSIFLSIVEQLRGLVKEMSYFNQSNQQLVQMSLSYIQYAIGIHIQKKPSIGYGPASARGYFNLLDAKV
jgi:flagellar biosynthesis/type III secretory pathway chaperone